jgi:hypothetical protein
MMLGLKDTEKKDFFHAREQIVKAKRNFAFEEFVSDPKKPVPYSEDVKQQGLT